MRSTLSAQQASCHFKGKLVILIFPKHKYYKNIIHLIGLTKCSFSGAHQQRSYKTRYKVSRCGCKYLKILCKRSVEDSLQATALRTAKKPPHKASCSSFKPQYDWEVSLKCGNSYSWIHNTLNKHQTLLKTSVLSTPHQISTMQLSAPCLLNFF